MAVEIVPTSVALGVVVNIAHMIVERTWLETGGIGVRANVGEGFKGRMSAAEDKNALLGGA